MSKYISDHDVMMIANDVADTLMDDELVGVGLNNGSDGEVLAAISAIHHFKKNLKKRLADAED